MPPANAPRSANGDDADRKLAHSLSTSCCKSKALGAPCSRILPEIEVKICAAARTDQSAIDEFDDAVQALLAHWGLS